MRIPLAAVFVMAVLAVASVQTLVPPSASAGDTCTEADGSRWAGDARSAGAQAAAEGLSAGTPVLLDKNAEVVPDSRLVAPRVGATEAPEPPVPVKNWDVDSRSVSAAPVSAPEGSPSAVPDARGAFPLVPISCGSSGNLTWTTSSPSFEVIRECQIHVPVDGWVLLSGSASVGRLGGEYEVNFRFGIDSTVGEPAVDRWVNVYDDAGDGTDQNVAMTLLRAIGPGVHTFYLLGARFRGTGTVAVFDPTLTVTMIPTSSSNLMVCGVSGNLSWTTISKSFEIIRECTLVMPDDGFVFLTADATVSHQDAEYEGSFRLGVDNTTGESDSDRWVDVYPDAEDGSDRTLAVSTVKYLEAGAHTFYLLGRRETGAGTVLVYDPTLVAFYAPASPSGYPVTCVDSDDSTWDSSSGTFEVVRQCTLTMSEPGAVLISANATAARLDGEYEGKFRIGIDNTSGDATVDRWVNVYDDSGDGSDTTVALSVLKPVRAGIHQFYFLANRYFGAGTLHLNDPALSVVQVDAAMFYDGFRTGDVSHWSSSAP